MSTVEFVTLTVSSIAIGAAVVSILMFILYAMMQKRLIVHDDDATKVTDETARTVQLFSDSLRDDVPDGDREVLKSLIRRYSETSLIGVFDDAVERGHLFEALANPTKLPWVESGGQRGESPK